MSQTCDTALPVPLVAAAVDEQSHTVEAVYAAHAGFVWRSLRALGVPAASLDDALQDVFVVVHKKLGDFHGPARVQTWLFEIARRVASHYRRAAGRAQRIEPIDETTLAVPAAHGARSRKASRKEAAAASSSTCSPTATTPSASYSFSSSSSRCPSPRSRRSSASRSTRPTRGSGSRARPLPRRSRAGAHQEVPDDRRADVRGKSELFRAARAGLAPTADDLERGRRRLRASIAAGATGGVLASAKAGAIATSTGKLAAMLAVALAAAGGIAWWARARAGEPLHLRVAVSPVSRIEPVELPSAPTPAPAPAPAPPAPIAPKPIAPRRPASRPCKSKHRLHRRHPSKPHFAPSTPTDTLAAELAIVRAADDALHAGDPTPRARARARAIALDPARVRARR